ncbi:MAG: undecaprenyldiphospho-muramoylpentapeptide beta-N-acetylglucosaminyltransferase [Bacteroidota bacterium]
MRVIISGGGTGGHVFPAIAIANALKEQEPTIDIRFVGAKGKLEMEKVPKAGYPIEGLWISGFHRQLTLRNLLFPFKLLSSLWKAFWIVRRFRPQAAVGVGGYASGPTLGVASRMGIPCLLQEQNSYAGVTNKLLAAKARRICVAYEGMERYFPSSKIVMTGNPVRQDILQLEGKRTTALKHFGFAPGKKTLLVFGGSLGARTLNQAMAASAAALEAAEEVQVLWQAGKLYIEEYQQTATAALPNVQIRAFIDRMDLAYAMADAVVCRAGALTISELCLAAKPAILVPSPNVAEDHQTHNAMALVKKEAAIMVKDVQAKAEMVPQALALLKDAGQQEALSEHIRQLGRAEAAKKIAAEVLQLMK